MKLTDLAEDLYPDTNPSRPSNDEPKSSYINITLPVAFDVDFEAEKSAVTANYFDVPDSKDLA